MKDFITNNFELAIGLLSTIFILLIILFYQIGLLHGYKEGIRDYNY